MRCATWNVNSLRARIPRVLEFLTVVDPDVLLLQETKCAPDQFPHAELNGAGWEAFDHSGGRWCGVAVLTRRGSGAAVVARGLPGEPMPEEARWIEVELGDGTTVVSVYAPNGREVDSIHFERKLEFFGAASRRARELAAKGPLVIGGDMNVAPFDEDVWDVSQFDGATHVTPRERKALAGVLDSADLVDAHVEVNGPGTPFTWWDYRGGSFHRGHGMRIDHFLVSRSMVPAIESVSIEREFRKGTKPSDHVPVVLRITDSD